MVAMRFLSGKWSTLLTQTYLPLKLFALNRFSKSSRGQLDKAGKLKAAASWVKISSKESKKIRSTDSV